VIDRRHEDLDQSWILSRVGPWLGSGGTVIDYDPFADGFEREVVVRFARRGIYPPPYAGSELEPESVIFNLTVLERWQAPPCLSGTDEEGVEQQMQEFDERVKVGLESYVGRDPRDFGSYHRK
jgi:hypothetical protein